MSAAVSVTAPLGSRTFVVSSESLPEELRDGLVAAWGALSA
jgi:threonine/homoserine/homoserine lactone efflux protein